MRQSLNDTVIELRSPKEIRSSSLFNYVDLIMSVDLFAHRKNEPNLKATPEVYCRDGPVR